MHKSKVIPWFFNNPKVIKYKEFKAMDNENTKEKAIEYLFGGKNGDDISIFQKEYCIDMS